MSTSGILNDDTYRVFIPIDSKDELMKSIEVDENGDYIVQGVMTAEDTDEEGDSITPNGMDCSYFLDKGWIKYEHGNNPNQFIGEPIAVKVGQFEHPTLHKSVNGIYVKGRLFAHRELAKQAVNAIQDLQKSKTKRTMGWSIEGNVKERDRKTGKIAKSILRNVVLTMNPVNTVTWAELAKSFAKNHELTIDMEDETIVNKAMDTAGAAAITPQSIEGYNPKEDEQEKWIKLFREFVKGNFLNKSLRNKFITSSEGAIGMTAYTYGINKGLASEDAYSFATYIADRQEVLKSLFRANFGGVMMNNLAKLLDADLDELQKSLEFENEESEDEELEKSVETNDDEKEDNEGAEEDDDEEDNEEDNEDEGDDKESEEDNEDEKTEKSIKTDFAKSFAADDANAAAFEVSDFLANLVDEVGYSMDGFAKSMAHVTKQNTAIVKGLMSVVDVVKGLATQVEDLKAENTDLQKSLNEVLERPVGRKSVVSTKEVMTLQKSMGAPVGGQLNREQISDVLMKSFEAGEIPGTAISRFEAGVSLDGLNLPKTVLKKLGL